MFRVAPISPNLFYTLAPVKDNLERNNKSERSSLYTRKPPLEIIVDGDPVEQELVENFLGSDAE